MNWLTREGTLWRSKDNKVLVTSKHKIDPELVDKPHYRIVIQDEEEHKEAKVIRCFDDDNWEELVIQAILSAEAYYEGKYKE